MASTNTHLNSSTVSTVSIKHSPQGTCQTHMDMLELHQALARVNAMSADMNSEMELDDAKVVLKVVFALDARSAFCQMVKEAMDDAVV